MKPGRKQLPIGTIVIRVHTDKVDRRWIKVAHPNKWIRYTIYLWKRHHGKIPQGMVVHHKDENSLNDTINNLELIDRKTHLDIHRQELYEIRMCKNSKN